MYACVYAYMMPALRTKGNTHPEQFFVQPTGPEKLSEAFAALRAYPKRMAMAAVFCKFKLIMVAELRTFAHTTILSMHCKTLALQTLNYPRVVFQAEIL